MRANLARHARRVLVRRAASSAAAAATPCSALTCSRHRPRSIAVPNAAAVAPRQFQRTFFDALFREAPREVRPPEYEPGWMEIMVWRSRMLDNLRPPPRAELREAWGKLMRSKQRTRMPLNSTQAVQCRRLLRYLARPGENGQSENALTAADLAIAQSVLLDVEPLERTQNHRDFAQELFDFGSQQITSREAHKRFLVRAFAQYGGSLKALKILYSKWSDREFATALAGEQRLIDHVLRGLAREGREEELVALIQHAETHGVAFDVGIQSCAVEFFATRDRVPETQHWFKKPVSAKPSRPELYQAVATFARRNHLQTWALPLFLELCQSHPSKRVMDALLSSILTLGKSLDEVRLLASPSTGRKSQFSPNVDTINGLLRVASAAGDAELAEDILALGKVWKISPNGETSLILLRLRLATGDLSAALEHYQYVHRIEPWNAGDETGPLFLEYRGLTNDYLAALCRQNTPDFKLMLKVLGTSEESQILLDAETVAMICLRFLENDQNFDVMDILSTYSFLYSEQQRLVVQDAFLSFCLDSRTSTARAWGAFQVLDQYFQDLSFESRNKLMTAFFGRRRPDMATQVVKKMRQHRHQAFHPTIDTYVGCFEGYAQYPDEEGLQLIYNMLKTDTTVQMNTKLYTALILAHTGCSQARKALDLWKEAADSPEGPSYATLVAVFWALEHRASGYKQAREIWDKIERMNLDVPADVYNAYIGAIANSAQEKELRSLIMNMPAIVGSEPDMMTLGIAYNALPGPQLQSSFQNWASKRYRRQWEELLKKGRRKTEFSLCQFRITRVLKA